MGGAIRELLTSIQGSSALEQQSCSTTQLYNIHFQ